MLERALIFADSCSVIAYLINQPGPDLDLIEGAIDAGTLHLPPPVIAELLSSHHQRQAVEAFLVDAPVSPLAEGFWERAGRNRALVREKGFKAMLVDALVAQCCIDADAPLITRDSDFRHFAKWCGLKLAE